MGKIGIVTDSTAYLDQSWATENDIKMVPLKVIFGDEVYREGIDITHEEFFRKLKGSSQFPTTSQPSVGEFKEAYEEMAQRYDELISLHISGGISGTVESARSAAQELESRVRIEVIDSRFTSISMYMILKKMVEGLKAGKDLDSLVKTADTIIKNMKLYFAVDTLEYLHKGGRIGGAQAFLGSMLKIKPILFLDGTIDALEKARGTQKAISRILEISAEKLGGRKAEIGITHVADLEAGESLKAMAAETLNCDPGQILMNETGPVIGSHTGPGTVGISFYPSEVLV
jgi:DegV family protein with EDD domain